MSPPRAKPLVCWMAVFENGQLDWRSVAFDKAEARRFHLRHGERVARVEIREIEEGQGNDQ